MASRSATLLGAAALVAAALTGLGLLVARQARADTRAASAGAAEVISYQGQLTDDQGTPLDGLVKAINEKVEVE